MATTHLDDPQILERRTADLQARLAQIESDNVGLARDLADAQDEIQNLRAGERLSRRLLAHLPACVYITSGEQFTTNIYVNSYVEALTGFSSLEWLRGRLWAKQIHPEDRARVLAQTGRCRATGEPFAAEYRLLTRAGRVIWIYDEGQVIPTVPAQPSVLCGIWQDITERKQAEQAVTESEQRYRTLVESMNDGLLQLNLDGVIQYANQRLCELVGCALPELIGQRLHALLFAEDWPLVSEMASRRRQGISEEYELRLKQKSGEAIWVLVSGAPMADAAGGVIGSIGIYTDITARKQAEQALHQAEARYRALVEQLPSIVHYISGLTETGPSLYISPQIELLVGFTQPEWLADRNLWARQLHPDDREREIAWWWSCCLAGRPYQREYRFLTRAGRVLWLHDEAVPVRDAAGAVIEYHGILLDITARKQAEAELHRRFEQLQALYQISDALNRADSLEAMYAIALDAIQRALAADRAAILLFDADGVGRFKDWRGLSETYRRAVEGQTPRPRSAADPQPILIPEVTETSVGELHGAIWAEGIRAIGFIPLVNQAGLLGKFMIYFDAPRRFSADEVRLAKTIAQHIAFALERRESAEAIQTLLRSEQDARGLAEARHAQLEALSRQLVEVQEAERRAIARELHDEVGQALTGIRLLLDMAAQNPEASAANLAEAQQLATELTKRVQVLSLDLRPTMLDDLGLLPALLWHLERFRARTKIRVDFKHSDIHRRFGLQAETTAYRLIQEALTNVARHAGVSEASVQVFALDGKLVVQVSDRGVGFDGQVATHGHSTGLSSMRERVTLLGGRWRIDSGLGQGTQIVAEIPVEAHTDRAWPERDQ